METSRLLLYTLTDSKTSSSHKDKLPCNQMTMTKVMIQRELQFTYLLQVPTFNIRVRHANRKAFSFPSDLSRKEVQQKTIDSLQLRQEDLSFYQVAPKTLAVSLKNSAFSLNYVEEVFRQNELMNTTIQQFGEALVTLKQKVEKETAERMVFREKYEKQEEKIRELEFQLQSRQTQVDDKLTLIIPTPSKGLKKDMSIQTSNFTKVLFPKQRK